VGHSANRVAVGFYEQALDALEHMPENRDALEQAIDIRLDLRRTLVPLADRARILGHMQKAEALAQRIGDQRRLSWVVYGMAHYHYLAHEQEQSVEASKRALALGERTDLAHEVAVNLLLGHSLHYTGDYREAAVVLRRNVEVLVGDRVRERFGLPIFPTFPAVTSRERLARCLAELGDFPEAIEVGEEGMRIAEDIDHPPSLTGVCLGLATVHMRREDFAAAIPILERGLAVGRRGNIFLYVYSVAAAMGRALAVTGRLAEGLALMSEVVTEAAAKHQPLGHSLRVMWLAEGYLAADDHASAWARAQEALAQARRYREKGQEVWTLHVLGEIARARDPGAVEEAERFYREAIAIADTLGMIPALAHCHLGLGELYAQAKRREVAQECLRLASELFRDIGIASLQERSERLRAALPG